MNKETGYSARNKNTIKKVGRKISTEEEVKGINSVGREITKKRNKSNKTNNKTCLNTLGRRG